MAKNPKHFIFTITPGRTGTLYLTNLLGANLPDCQAHHELIFGFDKFGVDTPEISHFHTFNSKGNTTKIQKFWKRKLTKIGKTKTRYYVETSHLLAKAGLVENLDYLKKYGKIHLIILKRDLLKIILSLHNRLDLINIGSAWMWFLDPAYPRKLVNPQNFADLGTYRTRFWYLCEMFTRAEYYKQLLKADKKILFHEYDIEQLNSKKQVRTLLVNLGFKKSEASIIIPPKANQYEFKREMDNKTLNQLKQTIKNMDFDPVEIAQNMIKSGERIG